MATPAGQHLGVTAPLSTALPTESENLASNALIEELKRQNNYESAADTQKRYVLLESHPPRDTASSPYRYVQMFADLQSTELPRCSHSKRLLRNS